MACALIAFLTFLISGLIQLFGNKTANFMLDCDERIELAKIKLKRKAQQNENIDANRIEAVLETEQKFDLAAREDVS